MPSPATALPERELDDYARFAARIGVSPRTVMRMVKRGMPVVHIGRLPRIDPVIGMAYVRGELPPVERPFPRRGRPRKAR